jgi:Domain of unknown function (DUF2341)
LLLLLPLFLFCAARPVHAAYTFNQTVTIDHTKVGSSDSTNFPFLFSGTYTYLKTVGNGGNVQKSSGYDIAFATSSACSSLLSFEMESYGASTGTVAFWVKIPTLSHTSDTVIYLCYGDATVSTFQGGAYGAAWDSNYKAVYHLPNGTTIDGTDSTVNDVDLTNSSGTAVAGVVDGGLHVASASSAQMDTANNPYSSSTFSSNGLTMEAWVWRDAPGTCSGGCQDGQVVNMEGAYTMAVGWEASGPRSTVQVGLGFRLQRG